MGGGHSKSSAKKYSNTAPPQKSSPRADAVEDLPIDLQRQYSLDEANLERARTRTTAHVAVVTPLSRPSSAPSSRTSSSTLLQKSLQSSSASSLHCPASPDSDEEQVEYDDKLPEGNGINGLNWHRAPLHPAEGPRLRALTKLKILDTPLEESYNDISLLAAQLCDAPMCAISFVDADRQFFKATVGLGTRQTSRDEAFCAYTIHNQPNIIFQVTDARKDSRFADNPLVVSFLFTHPKKVATSILGGPTIRFYAGVPLYTPSGLPVGALCVLDKKPRTLDSTQEEALRALARQVAQQLELRSNLISMQRTKRALELRNQQLRESNEEQARILGGLTYDLRGHLFSIMQHTEVAIESAQSRIAQQKQHDDTHQSHDDVDEERSRAKELLTTLDDTKGHISIVRSYARFMKRMVDEFLDVDKVKSNASLQVHCQKLDIVAVLQQCIQVDAPLAKLKGVKISLEVFSASSIPSAATLSKGVGDVGAVPKVGLPHDKSETVILHTAHLTPEEREKLIVHADPLKLEQVVKYLLAEALEYAAFGGLIRFTVWHSETSVVFCMADSGNSFSKDEFSQLFEEENIVNRSSGVNSSSGSPNSSITIQPIAGALPKRSSMMLSPVPSDRGRSASPGRNPSSRSQSPGRKLSLSKPSSMADMTAQQNGLHPTLSKGGASASIDQNAGVKRSLGLGLVIARSIVQAHAGDVWLEMGDNSSLFYVTLPSAHSPTAPALASPSHQNSKDVSSNDSKSGSNNVHKPQASRASRDLSIAVDSNDVPTRSPSPAVSDSWNPDPGNLRPNDYEIAQLRLQHEKNLHSFQIKAASPTAVKQKKLPHASHRSDASQSTKRDSARQNQPQLRLRHEVEEPSSIMSSMESESDSGSSSPSPSHLHSSGTVRHQQYPPAVPPLPQIQHHHQKSVDREHFMSVEQRLQKMLASRDQANDDVVY